MRDALVTTKNREIVIVQFDLDIISTRYLLIIEDSMESNLARVDLKCPIATRDSLVMKRNRDRAEKFSSIRPKRSSCFQRFILH